MLIPALEQKHWVLHRAMLCPKEHLATPGDNFGCHTWRRSSTTGNAAKYPTTHRVAPKQRTVQHKDNSVRTEK